MEQETKKYQLNNQEFISGIIALVLFGIIKILSMRLPAKVSGYPIVMSNVAFALTIVFFARCLYRFTKGTLNPKPIFKGDREGRGRYWLALALLVAYAGVFKILGFIISTLVFMIAFSQLFGESKDFKTNIIVSIAFTAVIYVTFDMILGIPLPVFLG